MSLITRRQFIRASGAAGIGALFASLIPASEARGFGSTPPEGQELHETTPQVWPLGPLSRSRTLILSWDVPSNPVFSPIIPNYSHQNGGAVLYEPCAFYSPLSDQTVLWLAESYQYNIDASELTITFRSGIKWSDGTPFTAEDVVWTINTLLTVDGLNRSFNVRSKVASVSAVNNLTVKIILNAPDWRFFFNVFTFRMDLGDYSTILPRHIYSVVPVDELSTFPHYDLSQAWPVTTGPYGVGEYSGGSYINYDLRPSWWAVDVGLVPEMPQVQRFRVENFTNEPTAVQRLANNEIDTSLDLSMPALLNVLSQNPDVTTYTGRQNPYGNVDWWPISVYFNCQKPPFDDKRVRWAVAYALNQQTIADIAYNGANPITAHPFPNYPMLMSYVNGISDLLSTYNVLEQNLTKVTDLMTAAGFHKDTSGYWVDAGEVRPYADLYAPEPLFAPIGPLIALQLRMAGFDCTNVNPPDVWTKLADGTAPLFLFGHGGGTKDPLDTFNLYRSANIAPMGEQSWGNLARWSHPTFETAADAMAQLPMSDTAGIAAQFRIGMQVWLEELPDCPMVQWMHHIPLNTKYWIHWPDVNNPYQSPALWLLGAHPVVTNLKMNLPHQNFLPALRR